jgi:hypothetical protein
MRVEEYLALTGKSANDHPTYADLIGIAAEKPPVDEVAEARAKKLAALQAQIKRVEAGEDVADAQPVAAAEPVKVPAEA